VYNWRARQDSNLHTPVTRLRPFRRRLRYAPTEGLYMNICKQCEKETKNPSFCSRSCSAVYNNKISPKRQLAGSCYSCSCPIRSTRKFCKPCWKQETAAKDMTLDEASYLNHHRSSCFALVRSRAREIFRKANKECSNCGYKKHVEVCHIKSISSFSPDTLLSVINSKDNLVLLCPNCHWEFDHKMLDISSISSYIDQ
jgi:5-methylcytosine-specific restriction endonuclease McrA